jgi:hypothetical protein
MNVCRPVSDKSSSEPEDIRKRALESSRLKSSWDRINSDTTTGKLLNRMLVQTWPKAVAKPELACSDGRFAIIELCIILLYLLVLSGGISEGQLLKFFRPTGRFAPADQS